MEDAASHSSTELGVEASGPGAFEEGELGAAMAGGFFRGGAERTDREAEEETTAMGAEESRSRRWGAFFSGKVIN